MNQKHNLNSDTAQPTLSDLFENVSLVHGHFKNSDKGYIDGLQGVSEALINLYNVSPGSLSFSLHTLNSKYTKNVNFIVKALALSKILSVENGFDIESQKSINDVTLFTALALTTTLSKVKRKELSLKQALSSFIRNNYSHSKQVFQNQASAFRLFTQVADINEFKNKNQFAQTIVIASLNIAAANVGLFNQLRLSLSAALVNLRFKPITILKKGFVKTHLPTLLSEAFHSGDAGGIGQLIRTPKGHFAFTLTHHKTLSGDAKWTIATIDQPSSLQLEDLNVISEKNVALLSNQPALDFTLLDQLISKLTDFDVIQKYNKEQQARLVERYSLRIPSGLNDFSKLLITSTNKQIADYLETQPATAHLIKDYASNLTRIHSPIKDLKHAAALIGLVKLYPVVCNSEILKYQENSHFIGSSEAFNKATLLQDITMKLARDLKCDIPEYLGTLSLIMCHSVLLIPKGRYSATAGKLENKQSSANLAEFFAISNIEQWLKITGKMAREWQLPNQYLSLCKDYFHHIEGRLDPNALPKSAKTQLATLLMAHWMFIQIQSGESSPRELPRTSLFRNVLGYSNTDIINVYRDVVESLAPKTDLR